MTGSREGVEVTRTSQSHTFSSGATVQSRLLYFLQNETAFFSFLLQTFISVTSRSAAMASSWAAAWRPLPTSPSVTVRDGARYFAATPPAAPVLRSVSVVAFRMATGIPVPGSRMIRSAITVGNPIRGFPGWTFTILTPARESEGMYAGIVLKSPWSKVT